MSSNDGLHTRLADLTAAAFASAGGVGMIAGAITDVGGADETSSLFAYGTTGTGAVQSDTIWQIGSLTKTFTAAMLALAVNDGRMDIHAPAQTYADPLHVLPSFSTKRPAVVDLATHTAGLPSDPRGVGDHGYSLDAMYGYLDLYALAVQPGTLWNYSNLGFGLLADLVRRASGATDYAAQLAALKTRTGLPLRDTVLELDAEQQHRFATGFASAGVPAPVRTPTWPAFNGSGALYSTAGDVLTWTRFMLGVPRTPVDPIRALITSVYFSNAEHNMGLAWDRQPLSGAATYWFKLGNTAGFSCFLAFSPELRCAVTVLSNSAWILWLQLGVEMLTTIAAAA